MNQYLATMGKNRGFTLLEILVASVILFSSMAVVSLIYRGALVSSEKANTHVLISGVVPAVLNTIREKIRQQSDQQQTEIIGNGIAWDVNYHWSAKLLNLKSAPPTFDSETGNNEVSPEKYKLWQVDLQLTLKGIKRDYHFKELSWNEK